MLDTFFDNLHRLKKRYFARVDIAQIPLIAPIRRQIISLVRKKVVEDVNGYTMHVDEIDSLALSWHRVFEPATTDFFKKNIRRGQTVIDLGANIGYYTLLFSRLVGNEGHVYAFEPEPESAKLLRKNIEINSVKNVTVVEKAVDSQDGILKLFVNKNNRGNHQIFDSGDKRESIEIRTTSLDSYFSNKDVKIDWIKMDIEGAEFRAIQGMKEVFERNTNLVLVTEIFAAGLSSAGTSIDEYVQSLKSLKFEFEEIDERNNKISPVTASELIRLSSKPRRFHPNVICRRKV